MNALSKTLINENDFTFDSFEVDSRNRLAYLAAVDVANTPNTPFNPLILYGNRYDGKTHLLKAMEWHIRSTNPGANVIYTTAKDFYYEYLEEARTGEMHMLNVFREKYRNTDVLIMDDIDFLSGKSVFDHYYYPFLGELCTPLEEFFYTFETVHTRGKRIVLASNRPPKELGDLDEMFGGRLEMGLVVGLRCG